MRTAKQWVDYYQTHHNPNYSFEALITEVIADTRKEILSTQQSQASAAVQEQAKLMKDNLLAKKQDLVVRLLCAQISGSKYLSPDGVTKDLMDSSCKLVDDILKLT